MNELELKDFEHAILEMHGAKANLEARVEVEETFRGATVWEGEVLVFRLEGHSAPKCYAWSVDGRVTAVLHEGPVDSPQAAVRAALAADFHDGQRE